MKQIISRIFLIIILQTFMAQNIAMAGMIPLPKNSTAQTMLSPRIGIMVNNLQDSFKAINSEKISSPALASFNKNLEVAAKAPASLLSQLIDKIVAEFEETKNDYKYSYLPDIIPLMNQEQINRYLNVLSGQISVIMADSTADMIKRTADKLANYPDIENNDFDVKDYFAEKLLNMMQHYFDNIVSKKENPDSYGLYPYFKAIGQLAGKNTYAKLKNIASLDSETSPQTSLVKIAQNSNTNTQILLNTMLAISFGELRHAPEDAVYDFLYSCAKMQIKEKDEYTPELKGAANMALGKLAARFLINSSAQQNKYLEVYNFLNAELDSTVKYQHSRYLYPTVGAAYGLGAMLTGRAEDWHMFFYVGFNSLYYVMDHPFIRKLLLQKGDFRENAIAKFHDLDKYNDSEKLDILHILLLHEKYLAQQGLLEKVLAMDLLKDFLENGFLSDYANSELMNLLGKKDFQSKEALEIILNYLDKNYFNESSARKAIKALKLYDDPKMIPLILRAYRYRSKDSHPEEAIRKLTEFSKSNFTKEQWEKYTQLVESGFTSGKAVDASIYAIIKFRLQKFGPYLKYYSESDSVYNSTLAKIAIAILDKNYNTAAQQFIEGHAVLEYAALILETLADSLPKKQRNQILFNILEKNTDSDVRKKGLELLSAEKDFTENHPKGFTSPSLKDKLISVISGLNIFKRKNNSQIRSAQLIQQAI